ncbi:hypothetical protein BO78DRAFT_428190 [Aspergillus sclerotiicarbonarius CBS 121057]|uniref:Uncharacterized protein n=1 Tax=Aspergillus sclerotiicarbonarius (strain CBS 121057 / IBT 28362) TaxID=1448318 RepID=A0A319EDK0_ASPSB|nr:hypothetical protein BO78DRAFT_428190 [Aspergillus sclerotiicarbonarius CBS 121057]
MTDQTYPLFHQPHPDLEDLAIQLAFTDTDGSPVYEDPEGGLLSHIIGRNDLISLHLYQESPHTKVFWDALDAGTLGLTLQVQGSLATVPPEAVDHHYRRRGDVCDERFTELIETLLANEADARFCLHRMCDGSWEESISPVLLDCLLQSVDINDADADGCAAMHYLVRHLDQIDAARHLIRRGADVNAINHRGNTPLHEVMKGTLLRKLDENGIPDPAQPRDAPVRAREEWIKVLVDAGGSMHQPNAAGETPAQQLDEFTKRLERQRQAETARGRWRGRGRGHA